MKNPVLTILVFVVFNVTLRAQLKTTAICPAFTVDILGGRVNDLRTTSTVGQIKTAFPCFTSAEDESATAKCGGGVFFKDKDIYFYTARDYVEIGPNFKGKLSIPLMGAARTSLFKWLGNPKIKDVSWDAFTTQYGILILYYNKANKVNKIQFSVVGTEAIKLCQ
ncbi:MAG TPA: hypothetical protein VFI06_13340 [Chitinophagaceae bacterium]|nr:hypothetical protein [Chitinophagaceae bacterium]